MSDFVNAVGDSHARPSQDKGPQQRQGDLTMNVFPGTSQPCPVASYIDSDGLEADRLKIPPRAEKHKLAMHQNRLYFTFDAHVRISPEYTWSKTFSVRLDELLATMAAAQSKYASTSANPG